MVGCSECGVFVRGWSLWVIVMAKIEAREAASMLDFSLVFVFVGGVVKGFAGAVKFMWGGEYVGQATYCTLWRTGSVGWGVYFRGVWE
ncbi:hypothetical protein Tco_1092246 [Tanacetum coccineum]|uniref:Transmembrane protein n=1 Tax=Tanacetum coccineum TaxID=301880 RepID=A0ABQ5IBH8_9ASTR